MMAITQRRGSQNKTVGAFGEKIVSEFLNKQGATIVDRNWRIKEGEIDIVARSSDGILTFIEVKTRTSTAFGHPLEAIGRKKALRLQRLALAWLATHQSFGCEYRIDCVAVVISADGGHTIDYRANVL